MSSEVKRYDPINSDGTCGMCIEDADYGAYVEYADYAALEAELAKLRAGQEPVASISWTNDDPEWKLKMLAEPVHPPVVPLKLYTAPQPSAVPDGSTKMQWPEIVALVNEVLGSEVHKFPCERGSIGHEMTGINFNSLARIIDRVRYHYAAPAAPTVPSVNQQLLEALEKVDSEHEILGRMKTCELRRGRGSFGIAVMSDELALDWQSHQKDLEKLIELRLAAIAAARKEGGK